MRPYQELIVWKEAHALCLWIYKITQSFPKEEKYRLVDQMCRSAASIPTNIAEGSAKKTLPDQSNFYRIAKGSLEELHYQCLLSRDLGLITEESFIQADNHIQRISFLLHKLLLSRKAPS